MRRGIFAFWGIVLLLLAGLYYWRVEANSRLMDEPPSAGVLVDLASMEPMEPFQLTQQDGLTFDSASLDSQVWVASFFFANCPSACVNLNNAIATLQEELGEKPVAFVSITVDPKHDTAAVLKEYAQRFDADPDRWHFLTGEQKKIVEIIEGRFKVSARRVTHSERLVLIGPDRRIVGWYRGTDQAEMTHLKRKIDELLSKASKAG